MTRITVIGAVTAAALMITGCSSTDSPISTASTPTSVATAATASSVPTEPVGTDRTPPPVPAPGTPKASKDPNVAVTAPRQEVESFIRATLEPLIGSIDSLTCPGDLSGPYDNRMECDFSAQGIDNQTVTVVVTRYEPATYMEYAVEDQRGPHIKKTELEGRIMDRLEPDIGAVDAVNCPGDLDGQLGANMRCGVSAQGQDQDYEVRVDAVTGDRIEFTLEPVA